MTLDGPPRRRADGTFADEEEMPHIAPAGIAMTANEAESHGVVGLGDEDDELAFGTPPLLVDVRIILGLAIPAILTQLFRVSNYTIVLVMCGWVLTPSEFGGLVLGMSTTNILVLSPGIGIAATLDTLCTQEYGRNASSAVQGLHLRRSLWACLVWCLLTTVVALFAARPVCVALFGQDLGHPASIYLRLSLLPGFPLAALTCLQKFLAAQGIVDVPLYAQAASTVALPVVLLVAAPHGIAAIAVAAGIARWTALGVAWHLAMRRRSVRVAFGTWSRLEVFDASEWRELLRKLVPSVAIICAERWSFESMSILAGTLGPVAVDAWAILLNVWLLIFSPCVGMYTAGATLVGNALGQGRGMTASRFSRRVFATHCTMMGCLCLLLALKPTLPLALYPNTPEVHELAARVAPIIAVAVFADTCAYVLQAILRAAGDVRFVAVLTMAAQWGASVGLAVLLLSVWHSVSALAIGLAIGCVLQFFGIALRVQTTDWFEVANRRHSAGVFATDDDDTASLATSNGAIPSSRAAVALSHAHGRLASSGSVNDDAGHDDEAAAVPQQGGCPAPR